jgi:BlaI family transcriptional regulator, penicillinase repressor
MRKFTHDMADAEFSRRERQIMDILYSAGEASARDIWERLPQAPTYSTVRTLLAVLEEKGHIVRRPEGKAFVYRPKRKKETAAIAALRRTLTTFFQGSVEQVVANLLEMEDKTLSDAELARIGKMIKDARKEKNT